MNVSFMRENKLFTLSFLSLHMTSPFLGSDNKKLTEECVNFDKPCADRGWEPSTADPVIVKLSQQ